MKRITITLISIFIFSSGVLCQSLPDKIDIGQEFEKVYAYNFHIQEANRYHHRVGKIKSKNILYSFIGLASISTSTYLLLEGGEIGQYAGPLIGGITIGLVVKGFNSTSGLKQNEKNEIEKAKAIFGYLVKT